MARYYRRRPARTYRRKRETFIARSRGAFDLTNTDASTIIDLFSDYENSNAAGRDVEGCTVTGIRGFWTYNISAGTVGDPPVWTAAGIRVASERMVAQVNDNTEQNAVGPLDGVAEYDWWQYINRRPNYVPVYVEGDSTASNDSDYQLWYHRQPVRVKSNRKLHTVDESLFAFFQASPIPETVTVNVLYDFALFCKRP